MINTNGNGPVVKNNIFSIMKKITPGDELKGHTYASPKQIREQLKDLDLDKFNNYYPYTYKEELILPGINKFVGKLPQGAELLPVSTKALNNMTKHLIKRYPAHASKELAFLNDGPPRIEFVQVTLLGTGLGLYYNQETGTPMGK